MGYPYDDYGGGDSNALPAPVVIGDAGACPPLLIEYRIYPEIDFNAIFGNPPASVTT